MANIETIRIEFQKILESIMDGNKVYYQPPSTKKIEYPCIVYSRNNIENRYASDDVYGQNHSTLPYARFSRHFTSDNLNHDVFTIYYK